MSRLFLPVVIMKIVWYLIQNSVQYAGALQSLSLSIFHFLDCLAFQYAQYNTITILRPNQLFCLLCICVKLPREYKYIWTMRVFQLCYTHTHKRAPLYDLRLFLSFHFYCSTMYRRYGWVIAFYLRCRINHRNTKSTWYTMVSTCISYTVTHKQQEKWRRIFYSAHSWAVENPWNSLSSSRSCTSSLCVTGVNVCVCVAVDSFLLELYSVAVEKFCVQNAKRQMISCVDELTKW